MSLSIYATALARTVASKVVGGLVGFAASVGVVVPAELTEQATVAVAAVVFVAAQLVYYVAARWLERAHPWIGQLLLWSGKQPVYGQPDQLTAMKAAADRPPGGKFLM
jgi:hypothetical protein